MMDIKIIPHRLCGEVNAVPSKSDFIRKLICASLSETKTDIFFSGGCGDTSKAIQAVKAMGTGVEARNDIVSVSPISGCCGKVNIDCGESAAVARFLLPVAAALGAELRMTGSNALAKRPLSQLTDLLSENGCEISRGSIPLTCRGRLCGDKFSLRGDISSQYLSGLLMALPLIGGGEIKLISPLQSRGYALMTIDTMRLFGVKVKESENAFSVGGGQTYTSPGSASTESDWSNALWLMAAAAIDGDIVIKGLSHTSLQPDRAAVDIIKSAGAKIEYGDGYIRIKKSEMSAFSADVSQYPDAFPVLASLAAVSRGKSRLYNASRLRLKESDRLETVSAALSAIGAEIIISGDSAVICGKNTLRGGSADSFSDHRVVMCISAVASACRSEVTIANAQAVSKSYPSFFVDFKSLGGMINVI